MLLQKMAQKKAFFNIAVRLPCNLNQCWLLISRSFDTSAGHEIITLSDKVRLGSLKLYSFQVGLPPRLSLVEFRLFSQEKYDTVSLTFGYVSQRFPPVPKKICFSIV